MPGKITTSQNETSFGEMLSNNRQFAIPPFQRPYTWKKKNFVQLQEDLEGMLDGQEDVHFMGAIIMDRRLGGTTDLDTYEVIDGQQRITTIYLTVCASVSLLLKHEWADTAASLAAKYLFATDKGYFVPKVSPSMTDRHDLNQILGGLLVEGLAESPQLKVFELKKLSSLGNQEGQISRTYKEIRKALAKLVSDYSVEKLNDLTNKALTSLSSVEIVVQDPSAGPKIFDSLNARQEPITTGDLVRNEIFGRIARDNPSEAVRMDEELWTPFYTSFGKYDEKAQRDYFEKFFFPAGLLIRSTLKKNEVFPALRSRWSNLRVPEIMNELNESRIPYQDIAFGMNEGGHSGELEQKVLDLHLMGLPSAAYPFVMKVLLETSKGELQADASARILAEVENFMVRRAICSIEPTGLHAVFKGLWGSLEGEHTAKAVKQALGSVKTVEYPNDEKVTRNLDEPLYGKAIAKYVIWSYDFSLGGDRHTKEDFRHRLWIEHVLPQSLPKKGWEQFDSKTHHRLVHQIGNLIPLTEEMNKDVAQLPFDVKKSKIQQKSKYISARELTSKYKEWGPKHIEDRTKLLKKWVLERW